MVQFLPCSCLKETRTKERKKAVSTFSYLQKEREELMNNRRGRVLIVDDEPRWREELVETLQEGGFHAEAIPTVHQALQRLSNTFFHLLILDIRMDNGYSDGTNPNIDG